MEEEKKYLAILTEIQLFRELRVCDESDVYSIEEKEKMKHRIKERFVSDSIKIFKKMKEEEIREHIEYVLERTKIAIDKINKSREDNER